MDAAAVSERVLCAASCVQVAVDEATDRLKTVSERFTALLHHASRAHAVLYPTWVVLPAVSQHFLPAAARKETALLSGGDVVSMASGTGVSHVGNGAAQRGGYSLYVPEQWRSTQQHGQQQQLMMVCALHGASGHGAAMLHGHGAWLRAARVRGDTLVLAPTSSTDVSWDVVRGSEAEFSRLVEMVDAVRARWPIEPSRVLISGISDGGTMAWLCGLHSRSPFTHIAPIASGPLRLPMLSALLQAATESMRSADAVTSADSEESTQQQPSPLQPRTTLAGKPVYMVHGARDFVFDVEIAREDVRSVRAAGAALTFVEAEDLGHGCPSEEPPRILQWLRETAPARSTGSSVAGVERPLLGVDDFCA